MPYPLNASPTTRTAVAHKARPRVITRHIVGTMQWNPYSTLAPVTFEAPVRRWYGTSSRKPGTGGGGAAAPTTLQIWPRGRV